MLDYLKLDTPELKEELEPGAEVILVDHNDPKESIDNLDNMKIKLIVDHHAVKINTSYPLDYIAKAVGCTNTILYDLYKENNIEISPKIASMMLSAIISDSLLFKSPTYTKKDEEVVKELEKISGLDSNEYGLELLKAGTDISDLSAREVLNADRKQKDFCGINASIAQTNTADISEVLKRENEILSEMKKISEEEKLELFVLLITDIVHANSMAIVIGEDPELIERAYNVKLDGNKALLEGVVSRKKQVIPILEDQINKEKN